MIIIQPMTFITPRRALRLQGGEYWSMLLACFGIAGLQPRRAGRQTGGRARSKLVVAQASFSV